MFTTIPVLMALAGLAVALILGPKFRWALADFMLYLLGLAFAIVVYILALLAYLVMVGLAMAVPIVVVVAVLAILAHLLGVL